MYAALGPLSPVGRNLWTTREADFVPFVEASSADDIMESLLDELTGTHMQSTHPNVKQAACLWLLALVKHSCQHAKVRAKLFRIQAAFMGLLGDNNDLVQDAASKGLSLVYEHSSEEQRDQLLKGLMGSLMHDNKQKKQVGEPHEGV